MYQSELCQRKQSAHAACAPPRENSRSGMRTWPDAFARNANRFWEPQRQLYSLPNVGILLTSSFFVIRKRAPSRPVSRQDRGSDCGFARNNQYSNRSSETPILMIPTGLLPTISRPITRTLPDACRYSMKMTTDFITATSGIAAILLPPATRPVSPSMAKAASNRFRLFAEFFTHPLRDDGIVPRDEITDVA